MRQNKQELILGIMMTGFLASLVIFSLYLPTYLSTYFQYAQKDVYLAMTWGMLWSAVSMPCCGWIADRMGRTKTFVTTTAIFGMSAFGLFHLLHLQGMGVLIAFVILYQTAISFATVSYFALLSAAFPTAVRYTGIAICYNVAYSAMSCAPIVITALINSTNTPTVGVWFLITFSLIGAVGALFLSKRRAVELFEV
jgi:MHS family proline/betaine transporter-like MFS transporter